MKVTAIRGNTCILSDSQGQVTVHTHFSNEMAAQVKRGVLTTYGGEPEAVLIMPRTFRHNGQSFTKVLKAFEDGTFGGHGFSVLSDQLVEK